MVVVCPTGLLTVTAARILREQLQTLIDAGDTRLVVDLSAVDAIDSSGLGALLYGLKAARERGGELLIAGPNKQVRSVLAMTRVDTLLKTCRLDGEAVVEEPRLIVFETTTGPETLEAVRRACDEAWSDDVTVPESIRMEVATAATEIAANIVEHAGRGRPVQVRMELHLSPGEVRIEFTDSGEPADIDLGAVRMPDPLAERGRGLAIALGFLRELSYRRDESGNRWTLVSRRFG